MADAGELVARLTDFRQRAAAMKALLLLGSDAVEPLMAALEHPVENVRWAAARVLGQIGDARALRALERVPPTGAPGEAAREAVAAIRAVDQPDVTALVHALDAEPDIEARGEGSRWVLRLSLPDGRQQKVRLDLDVRGAENERLVALYSACGPSDPARHEAVLRANLKLRYGALAITDIGGVPHYVAVSTHPIDDLDTEMLERLVQEIATAADTLERALSDVDRF